MSATTPGEDDPRVGTTVGGKWLLERKLGEGGMGAVYAARHVRNGKRAAIKILHAHADRTGALFARFRREARIAPLLERSGGVVDVYDDDVCDDGSPYIVMELLEGENFEELARRAGGTLPILDVVAMADAVLLVLAEAHRRGVVHRDLKPANVFRTTGGRIKVLDFGIAALHAEADELGRPPTKLTQPSTPMLGSIGFMPPEQARGEWESLDGRSDLWALGATMFALLGGRTVHAATSARKELVRTMLEEPAPLASVAPHAPEGLCRVVDRALAFAREKRWPDATSMRAALLAVDAPELDPLAATQEAVAPAGLAGPRAEGVTTGIALAPSTAPGSPPPVRAWPRLAALLVLAGSVVIGIVVVATIGRGRRDVSQVVEPPPVATAAETPAPVATVVVTAQPATETAVGSASPRATSAPPRASSAPPVHTTRPEVPGAPPRGAPTSSSAPLLSAPPPIIPLPPAPSATADAPGGPDLDRRR